MTDTRFVDLAARGNVDPTLGRLLEMELPSRRLCLETAFGRLDPEAFEGMVDEILSSSNLGWLARRGQKKLHVAVLNDLMHGQGRDALLAVPSITVLQLLAKIVLASRVAEPGDFLVRIYAETLSEVGDGIVRFDIKDLGLVIQVKMSEPEYYDLKAVTEGAARVYRMFGMVTNEQILNAIGTSIRQEDHVSRQLERLYRAVKLGLGLCPIETDNETQCSNCGSEDYEVTDTSDDDECTVQTRQCDECTHVWQINVDKDEE